MTKHKVFVLPDAEAEVAAAYAWYSERNPQAAASFRAEVFEIFDSLSDRPTRWRTEEDGAHRRVMRHFPYTVVFDVEGDAVYVLAVAHHRRAPGYWQTH